ncbi:MAG: CBS domain-containing protein [Chloroflexota bacterium]|nr:CBS domain-containing protein [Chloroflexota bacterium]MDE3192094.1 CBS domain-containing protein [Chloroflexota bacterium]
MLNDERVLLGRLQRSDLERAEDDAAAEDAMHPGPLTFRPDHDAHDLLQEMRQRRISTAPITTSDGVFVGIVRREDLEPALSSPGAGIASIPTELASSRHRSSGAS